MSVTASIAMVSATAQAVLAREQWHVIGGERVASADGRTFESLDPATGDVLASVSYAGETEVDAAVQAARSAFEPGSEWRRLTPSARGRLIGNLATLIAEHGDELVSRGLSSLTGLGGGGRMSYAFIDAGSQRSRSRDVGVLEAVLDGLGGTARAG